MCFTPWLQFLLSMIIGHGDSNEVRISISTKVSSELHTWSSEYLRKNTKIIVTGYACERLAPNTTLITYAPQSASNRTVL
jgi:hypothetical protein